jgi:hypothetical protein
MTVTAVTDYHVDIPDRTKVYAWEGMSTDDTGHPVNIGLWSDKSVHFFGDFGSGATVVIQGSNDPRANPKHADHASAEWVTLTDPQGNAISKTAASLEQIMENTWWIRPSVTGGTTPNLNVVITMKRSM